MLIFEDGTQFIDEKEENSGLVLKLKRILFHFLIIMTVVLCVMLWPLRNKYACRHVKSRAQSSIMSWRYAITVSAMSLPHFTSCRVPALISWGRGYLMAPKNHQPYGRSEKLKNKSEAIQPFPPRTTIYVPTTRRDFRSLS